MPPADILRLFGGMTMRLAALLISLLAGVPAFGSVVYDFSVSWIDPAGSGSIGFIYESQGFYPGGTLTPDQATGCRGYVSDPTPRCGAALARSDASGTSIDRLVEYYLGEGQWSDPEPMAIGAFFPGVQLDEFGSWTVTGANVFVPGEINTSATLTITDPPDPTSAPEPAAV